MHFVESNLKDVQSLLLEQYRKSFVVNCIIEAFCIELQKLEKTFTDLYYNRWLSKATAATLDKIGAMFLVDRNYQDDETYRQIIYTKIIINNGGGTPEDIKNALKLRFGSLKVNYTEEYPAKFALTIVGGQLPAKANTLIELVKPVGVDYSAQYVLQKKHFIFSELTLDSFNIELIQNNQVVGQLVTNDGSQFGVTTQSVITPEDAAPLGEYDGFLDETYGECIFAEIIQV